MKVSDKFLFVGNNNGVVIVWNWKTHRHVNQLAHRLGILVLRARNDGELMIGSRDHTASLWMLQTADEKATESPVVKVRQMNRISI